MSKGFDWVWHEGLGIYQFILQSFLDNGYQKTAHNAGLLMKPTIRLQQAVTQVNQSVSTMDRPGNITNFTKNCAGRSFFFLSRLKGELFLNFCICHKKRYNQENI